ncbi:hypothetical protein L6R49_10355 [Myxococcota bacterium]|nr:hypothetical protein [Myxococcota bacterium]
MTDAQRLVRVIRDEATKVVMDWIYVTLGRTRDAVVRRGRHFAEVVLHDGRVVEGQHMTHYGVATMPPSDLGCLAVPINGQDNVAIVGAIDAEVDFGLAVGDVVVYRRDGARVELRGEAVKVITPSGGAIEIVGAEVRLNGATASVARVGDTVAMDPLLASALTALAGVPVVAPAAAAISAAVTAGTVGTIATGSASVKAGG